MVLASCTPGCLGELVDEEALVVGDIAGNYPQHRIHAAQHDKAIEDSLMAPHLVRELIDVGTAVPAELHLHQQLDRPAKLGAVEQRHLLLDNSSLPKLLEPPPAWRLRQTN